MVSRFRSWWQQIKQHWTAIGVVGVVLVLAIALIIVEVLFNGTGFNGYNQVTTAHTLSGPSAGTVVRTDVYQPGKALWDWLQLAIIPVAIAFGVLWLNRLQQQRDQLLADERAQTEREAAEKRAQTEHEAAEKRAQTEREIASDNQREAALQAYIDDMSVLLLEKNLRNSDDKDEVRNIARVRTLTVLPRLDGRRKASVLQFLHESGLIKIDTSIIDLSGADLDGADLRELDFGQANLIKATLKKADLSGAKLICAYLNETDLRRAGLVFSCLSGSDMIEADLREADLREAMLEETDLRGAKLEEADLRNAYLTGADLRYAELIGANLIEARLEKADLRKANLTGAKVTEEQLKKAMSLEGAIMPDGSKHV